VQRPSPHRVAIPHLLQGKRCSETAVKILGRSNGRIKSPFESLLRSLATRPPPHSITISHLLQANQLAETPIKIWGRSNGRIKSYGSFKPGLWFGAQRPQPHRVAIPHVLEVKTASGNPCKNFRVIQRSDQKLWPFRTGNLVWSVETFASPSSHSTYTQ
jgi:hypothetical protein